MAHPRIFVSHSHADTKQKERLLKHLTPLDNAVEFDVWTDTKIGGGETWEPAIENALSTADVAILLVTADFLSSDFIRHKEVPSVLKHRENGGMRLYPILAKACAWQAVSWLEQTQIRPVAAKPVWRSGGRYGDDELARIALELLAIIQLIIQVKDVADEAARQKAEQQRREKEKAIAEVIAQSPPVESLYPSPKVENPFAVADSEKFGADAVETDKLDADQAKAQEIYRQIADDAAKNQAERVRIMKELQAKIFDITQDAGGNRFKSARDAFSNMDKYIREP